MKIPVETRGRSFKRGKAEHAPGVVIIDEVECARKYFPMKGPIGKRVIPEFL